MTNQNQLQQISEEQFNTLLYTWGDSPQNFLAFVEQCAGLSKDSEGYHLLKEAVKTQSDLNHFICLYDGDFNNLVNTAWLLLDAA